jgi:hypothetical protein
MHFVACTFTGSVCRIVSKVAQGGPTRKNRKACLRWNIFCDSDAAAPVGIGGNMQWVNCAGLALVTIASLWLTIAGPPGPDVVTWLGQPDPVGDARYRLRVFWFRAAFGLLTVGSALQLWAALLH